jgi:hypothetical protein
MTNETTVGRCGIGLPRLVGEGIAAVCALPWGHQGWHRGDSGAEWSRREDPTPDAFPTTGAGWLELGGLTAEQEIRARALDVAGRKFGSFGYDVEELLDTSDRLVAYIRDGVRVSAEERSDDTSDLGGSE